MKIRVIFTLLVDCNFESSKKERAGAQISRTTLVQKSAPATTMWIYSAAVHIIAKTIRIRPSCLTFLLTTLFSEGAKNAIDSSLSVM